MQLQIITPDHLMCDESVKMVEMRTAEGEIGVLPGHIPVTVMMRRELLISQRLTEVSDILRFMMVL